jgi:chaperonin GroES
MAETLKPLEAGVLVRVAKAEDTSAGGIIIPDAAKEKPRRGEVLAVGPGTWHPTPAPGEESLRPVGVKRGETVLFGAYSGTKVGEDLLLLRESDLLAVVVPARPVPCEAFDTSKAEDVPPVSLEAAIDEATRTLPDGSTVPASTGLTEWNPEWDKPTT